MANATYWIGQDGNIYYGSGQAGAGVQNLGKQWTVGDTSGAQFLAKDDGLYDVYTDSGTPSLVYSASRISDPAVGGQTLGASTGASGLDANTRALYDQAIGNTQAAIDRTPAQLNSALGGVDTQYQNAFNQLLLGKNQANSAYDSTKLQQRKDYVGAKNTIGSMAGGALNGLLRLLGSHGVAGSPIGASRSAVARGASLQRSDVSNTFGANQQSLDTNWNNYLTGYNNEVASAGNQRDLQKQNLTSASDTNKAGLLQSLAQLVAQRDQGTANAQPYLNQANSLLDRASNYTVAPINFQTQAYNAPSLDSYTFNPSKAPQLNSQAGSDYFSPYLSALLGKKQPRLA